MSIIDRPKAPPVCHGERMGYSESTKGFYCARGRCAHFKPLHEYIAERSNYHLEDMAYQAKVEAVRSYIKGEPVPEWARERLATDTIGILERAKLWDEIVNEPPKPAFNGVEFLVPTAWNTPREPTADMIVTAVDHERSEVTVSSLPSPAIWCPGLECPVSPTPHHRQRFCPWDSESAPAWGDRPPVPSPEREHLWPRPAVADAADELNQDLEADRARYGLMMARECDGNHAAPQCADRQCWRGSAYWLSRRAGAQPLSGGALEDAMQAAVEDALAEVEDLDRRSHAYLQGFFRRHGSLSRNPMEPSDLGQRIAQATAEGKAAEQFERDIAEVNGRKAENFYRDARVLLDNAPQPESRLCMECKLLWVARYAGHSGDHGIEELPF